MKTLSLGGLLLFVTFSALTASAQECSQPEDGDLFVDKDWHTSNSAVGEPDGRYPGSGGVAPFATIQAMIDVIEPGQCGYVRASTTPYQNLEKKPGESLGGNTFLRGGSAEEGRVIVSGYPGERPVIDIEQKTTSEGHGVGGFLVAKGDYITIRNFEIRNTMGPGVMMHHANTNRYITVENCHIHHIYGNDNIGAVRLDWCDNCLVRNNVIHDTYKIGAGSNGINDVPHLMHSGVHGYRPSNSIIENNRIFNVRKGVYQKEPHPDGLKSNVVRQNIFYNIDEAAFVLGNMGAGMSPSYGAEFHHNLVFDAQGVVSASFYEANGTSSGLKVYNNTVVNTQYVVGIANVADVEFYNNLIVGSGANGPLVANRPGESPRYNSFKEVDYNLYFDLSTFAMLDRGLDSATKVGSLDSWKSANELTNLNVRLPEEIGINSLYDDPLFRDGLDKNFLLNQNSKAHGRGKGGASIGAYGNGLNIGPEGDIEKAKIKRLTPCIKNINC